MMRTRPISPSEVPVVWPAIRGLGLAEDARALAASLEREPWSVRVSAVGDVLVLGRWRSGSDVFAIRRLVAPPSRVPGLVAEARSVVAPRGAHLLLSPLVDAGAARWYRAAGMRDVETIVVFSGSTSAVRAVLREARDLSSGLAVGEALRREVGSIVAVDRACFSELWQYGDAEILEAMARGRVAVVRDGTGAVVAYASSLVVGSTVTLARLAVSPAYRRRGIARALVVDAACWRDGQGAERFSVCTQRDNRAARALYAACGLSEVAGDHRLLMIDV